MSTDEEKKYDELEGLPFITALIQDKKYHEVIKQFPSLKVNKSQLGYLHYYLGDAHYQLKNYSLAYTNLKVASGFPVPKIDFYKLWGRTSRKLKRFSDCSEFFSKAGVIHLQGQDWITYFGCLKQNNESKKLLALALNHKSQDFDFFLVSQKFLTSLGLHSFAKTKRQSFFESCKDKNDYLKTWSILEKLNFKDGDVLEFARRCHPNDLEITGLMVKNLFTEGKYHSIAYIFEQLSVQDPAYFKHAGEFYKVAGRFTISDYYNLLGDEAGLILAKSSKFLNEENHAGLLTIPFKANSLKENKDLAYAVAYSQFKYLTLQASKSTLMAQHKLNSKDNQLMELITKCLDLDWRCRP